MGVNVIDLDAEELACDFTTRFCCVLNWDLFVDKQVNLMTTKLQKK
jgi:hypothetical protein